MGRRHTPPPHSSALGGAVVLCLIAQAAEQEGDDLGAGAGQPDLVDLTCRQCRCGVCVVQTLFFEGRAHRIPETGETGISRNPEGTGPGLNISVPA